LIFQLQMGTLVQKQEEILTPVYPTFRTPKDFDLWFTRISGCGLGNCFYTYFHAVVLAERFQGTVIAPPWLALKLGPLLRGESSKRIYYGMFKPYPGDISGLRKLLTLLRGYRNRKMIEIDGAGEPSLFRGRLNFVAARRWTFHGLHPYRELIRKRLLGIIRDPLPAAHCWGQGQFVAVHVRLSDFAKVDQLDATKAINISRPTNTRIPITWYVNVVRAIRRRHPGWPVLIFSDGKPEELRPMLDIGTTLYRSGSDITDLLQMSAASIFVGSNSSYSRWAAFLGNMPSVWLAGPPEDATFADESCADRHVPTLRVPLDATEVAL
jgi:hypothetical protein